MQGLLPIGHFSQASRLSIRTLRRYDADRLLVPAMVDAETSRRYYSPAQLADARLIRLLRDLDLPLDEIRVLLAERDPALTRQRLAAHRDRVAGQLAHQRAVLTDLDHLLSAPRPVTAAEVTRRTLPAQTVLSTRLRTSLAELQGVFGGALGRVERALHDQLGRRAGPTLTIYHGAEFDPHALDLEIAIPVAGRPRAGPQTDVRPLPAVDALTTLHAGAYDRIGDAYAALAAWAAGHGHDLGPDPRETYLVGPDRAGPEGWRTEVAWPLAY